mgnify:CR=1 FL=1
MSLKSKIESLLFVAGKPLTAKKIAEYINNKNDEGLVVIKIPEEKPLEKK